MRGTKLNPYCNFSDRRFFRVTVSLQSSCCPPEGHGGDFAVLRALIDKAKPPPCHFHKRLKPIGQSFNFRSS